MLAVADNRDFLINVLKNTLNWSESIINSFSKESLKEIYDLLLNREQLYKSKVSNQSYKLSMVIPKRLRTELGITYGDRFNIKLNLHKKEVYLYLTNEGKHKIHTNGIIHLPMVLTEKKMLKSGDDVMVTVRGDKITLKSFSYMQ